MLAVVGLKVVCDQQRNPGNKRLDAFFCRVTLLILPCNTFDFAV
jgi:hypothetical protein